MGFAATQTMIEVNHTNGDPEIVSRRFQQSEECNRIRAAGKRDTYAIAGRKHPRSLKVFQNGLFERDPHNRSSVRCETVNVVPRTWGNSIAAGNPDSARARPATALQIS